LGDFPRQELVKTISIPYTNPPQGVDQRHQGVDFVFHLLAGVDHSILGTPAQSVLPGWVAASVVDSFPFGNMVIIETPREELPADLADLLGIEAGQSLYHLYAHLQEAPLVALGDRVEVCQQVGLVGASGNTEAPHLHFETRAGPVGVRFPVMSAFVVEQTVESRQNYMRWRASKEFRHFDPMILMGYQIEE
jgi:murein DD-endopeptidase MepM/ murein hydrolase activator NlpD